MQKLFFILVLLLTTGAFLNFWVADADSLATAVKGDAQLQWFWLCVDSTVMLLCLPHVREIIRAAKGHIPLLLFVVWGTFSISWSLDPVLSVRRIAGLICTSALGLYLGIRYDVKTLLKVVGRALAIAVAASFLAALFLPSFGLMWGGLQGSWRGVFVHKNTMARVMVFAAISFSYLCLDSKRNRWFYAPCLLGALTLIALSQSMSAAAVLALAGAIGFLVRVRLRPFAAIASFAILLLAGVAIGTLFAGKTDAALALVGKDSTLTGRTYLWQLSLDAVWHRPFLGSGWDVFWGTAEGDRIRALIGWDAPHAHNAFLDFSLNVGIVGLLLFLSGLLDGIRKAIRYAGVGNRPFSHWPLLFYSFVFIYMFTETMIVDRHSIFQILFCAIPVAMKREEENTRASLKTEWDFKPELSVPEPCALLHPQIR